MITALSIAAAVSALAAIAGDRHEQRHPSFYVLKPLTTLLIAAIAWQAPAGDYRSYVIIGLLLSCLGDISLMFHGNRWFMGGLSSFLLAHIAFLAAYLAGVELTQVPWWTLLFLIHGLVFFGWLLPKTGSLKIPVIVYGTVLMGMAVAASTRWQQLQTDAAMLAMVGAVLFVISDSALAVRQFNGRYRGAQPLILSTYWSAIGLMAYSAI